MGLYLLTILLSAVLLLGNDHTQRWRNYGRYCNTSSM